MLPLEGRNLLMVTWLPSTELYKSVEPLVKEGEKNLYLFGREVHLVFCNDPSRFGAGIGYLTARGDQAFFSLYVCEQTEEMSEKYIRGDGFSGQGIGRPEEYSMTESTLS